MSVASEALKPAIDPLFPCFENRSDTDIHEQLETIIELSDLSRWMAARARKLVSYTTTLPNDQLKYAIKVTRWENNRPVLAEVEFVNSQFLTVGTFTLGEGQLKAADSPFMHPEYTRLVERVILAPESFVAPKELELEDTTPATPYTPAAPVEKAKPASSSPSLRKLLDAYAVPQRRRTPLDKARDLWTSFHALPSGTKAISYLSAALAVSLAALALPMSPAQANRTSTPLAAGLNPLAPAQAFFTAARTPATGPWHGLDAQAVNNLGLGERLAAIKDPEMQRILKDYMQSPRFQEAMATPDDDHYEAVWFVKAAARIQRIADSEPELLTAAGFASPANALLEAGRTAAIESVWSSRLHNTVNVQVAGPYHFSARTFRNVAVYEDGESEYRDPRNDPEIATDAWLRLRAADFRSVSNNSRYIDESDFARNPVYGYVTHLMGEGDARLFFRLVATRPNARLADMPEFSREAAQNPGVFLYDDGSARSARSVLNRLTEFYNQDSQRVIMAKTGWDISESRPYQQPRIQFASMRFTR